MDQSNASVRFNDRAQMAAVWGLRDNGLTGTVVLMRIFVTFLDTFLTPSGVGPRAIGWHMKCLPRSV